MSQIVTGVIGTVIAAAIVHWLGIGGTKTVVTIYGQRSLKKWKALIVIGWILMIVGAYLAIKNAPLGGMQNPYTGYGINMIVVGFALELVGEFMVWWNKA